MRAEKDRATRNSRSPDDVWTDFLAVNATAVFLCTKLVARHIIQRGGGGRIINIGSDVGKRARRMTAAYAASKFAVIGLTQRGGARSGSS